MDRVIDFRRPEGGGAHSSGNPPSESSKLSKSSRTFFLLNIVQVILVFGIQTTMMIVGDFKAIDEGGMGPGRRLYMGLFCGAVVYSCFLCLFAVKSESFLEIVAFVLQNFGYITYNFVQVYHISYKSYHGLKIKKDKNLAFLAITNCIVLIVLNICFTYLARQLFKEYGWKIYKRVRFNVRLRAAYHYYELVICLMKMTMLFVLMFTICLNQTMLRDFPSSINYICSLLFVPFTLCTLFLAIYGIRKENRLIMGFFIVALITGQGLACYEIYSVGKRTCEYCQEFYETTIDIPEEVILHVVYLASVTLLMMFLLTLATLKGIRNFGMGLKGHFAGVSKNSTILLMGFPGDFVRSIFRSSTQKSDNTVFANAPDIDENDIIINNDQAVSSSDSRENRIDLGYLERSMQSVSDALSSEKFKTTTAGTINENKLRINLNPELLKSNSLPGRVSDEQRPSVMDRISKQASSKLHKLYYRNISIESTRNVCGCCFWRKRESINSFGVSMSVSDDTLSNIFGNYYTSTGSDEKTTPANSNVTEFYNSHFSPSSGSEDDEFSSAVHVGSLFSSSHRSNNNNSSRFSASTSTTNNPTKFRRPSELRNEVSNLVSDVIVEEIEESPSPNRLLMKPSVLSTETVVIRQFDQHKPSTTNTDQYPSSSSSSHSPPVYLEMISSHHVVVEKTKSINNGSSASTSALTKSFSVEDFRTHQRQRRRSSSISDSSSSSAFDMVSELTSPRGSIIAPSEARKLFDKRRRSRSLNSLDLDLMVSCADNDAFIDG